jgi:hypothetical protein
MFLCDFEVPVSGKYIKLLGIAQQCFYGKFILPKKKYNILSSSCKVPDAALKQKNIHLLMAFFRRVIVLNRS